MTVIEKKKALKKIIDALPEENLDETFMFIEELASKEDRRIKFVKNLLVKEKNLFKRLAQ